MSLSIRVRSLTQEEEEYFRNRDLGRLTVALGSLSIMGSTDQTEIKYNQIEIKLHTVYLGGGQYIENATPLPLAKGGKIVPVVWGADSAYLYLLVEARKLDIPVFYTPTHPQSRSPLYFQSKYADAFINSFSYADRAFGEWYKNRPFFARWSGGMELERNSKEAKDISTEVYRILAKSKSDS